MPTARESFDRLSESLGPFAAYILVGLAGVPFGLIVIASVAIGLVSALPGICLGGLLGLLHSWRVR